MKLFVFSWFTQSITNFNMTRSTSTEDLEKIESIKIFQDPQSAVHSLYRKPTLFPKKLLLAQPLFHNTDTYKRITLKYNKKT